MSLSKIQGNTSQCPGDAEVRGGLSYPFKCDVCDRKFKYGGQKRTHELIHSEICQFSCEICAKAFKQRSSLYSHMYVHKEDYLYKCTRCCYESKRKGGLKQHMMKKRNHNCRHEPGKCPQQLKPPLPPPQEKFFKCLLCESKFKTSNDLQMHYDTSHAEMKRKHVEVAEGPKTKKVYLEFCLICGDGKQFQSKSSFTRHMKTHLNVKKHKCNICNKEFLERFNYNRHVELHRKEVKASEQAISPSLQNGSVLGASNGEIAKEEDRMEREKEDRMEREEEDRMEREKEDRMEREEEDRMEREEPSLT